MIIEKTTAEIERSNVFQEFDFKIGKDGYAHIFGILRNQLYSDKPLAVAREYMVNAYDSHVAAGKGDVPFHVSLPNAIFPNFRVRDFGVGLSEEEMEEVFASYGESTKRESNDYVGFG